MHPVSVWEADKEDLAGVSPKNSNTATYSSLVDARLADMTLHIAKLALPRRHGRHRGRRGP